MNTNVLLILPFLIVFDDTCLVGADKNPDNDCDKNSWIEYKTSAKFDNPNFIKDRSKNEIKKPEMPQTWADRHKQPYNPNWMDYCDPYHCNDYHKQACGLNRRQLKFKWFQSTCHMIINNMCAKYRGHLKYDKVDTKFCNKYVMNLRTRCPQYCEDDTNAICALDSNNKAAIFVNQCALEMENCQRDYGYKEVEMSVCEYYLNRGAAIVPRYLS